MSSSSLVLSFSIQDKYLRAERLLLPKTQTIRLSGRFSLRRNLLPIGPAPDPEIADPDTIDKYYDSVNLEQEVACIMLSSMSLDLHRTLKKYNTFNMMKELKTMFEEQANQELFKTVKAFHACEQEDGQSVSCYLLKMKSYLDILERLCYVMPNELDVDELHVMLKLHEKGIPKKAKTPTILAIREGKIQKDKKKPQGAKGKDKGKTMLAYAPKPKIPPSPKRDNPAKDSVCHHCHEVENWRRNCPSYHAELKKRKNASIASTSGIFTIELYAFPNKTWVYDTSCETHICNTSQGLRGSRKFKHGALSLYVGNGMREAVEAIRSSDLVLPSGLIIVLDNCHVAPTITRGVDLISHLVNNASGSNVAFLVLYVDDILLMGNNVTMLQEVKSWLYMVLVYGAKLETELKSAKQSTTTMSSTYSEYIDAAKVSMEAVWMRKFIDGLRGVVPSNKRPMEILCDNELAIAISNDPQILKGAKHF
ncbi:hypothetical protein Tco_0226898 [Tanacetum coccineum]